MTIPAAALPPARPLPARRWRQGGARATALVTAGVLALLTLLGVVVAPSASATPTGTVAGTAAAGTTAAGDATVPTHDPRPIVLVAVAGLYWSDVSPSATPTLWSMIRTGSVASLNLGRTTCTTDAWLTLSAGQMVSTSTPATEGAEETEEEEPTGTEAPTTGCPPLPVPATTTSGATAPEARPADVPGWATLTAPSEEAATAPTMHHAPGTLATRLGETGVCTTAVGPGAAVMLADPAGHVDRYAPALAALPAGDLDACDVTVVDQGEIVDSSAGRGESLDELDDALSRVMDEVDRGTRVLVAGVSAGPVGEPGLQVVVDWRKGEPTSRWLHSPSTQKDGLVQLVDLTATVVESAGGSVEGLDGAPMTLGEVRRMDVARTVENRQYLNVLTSTIPTLYPVLVGLLVATLVVALGSALWSRRSAARRGLPPRPGPTGRRVLSAVLMIAAAAPVAASLASLSRWWVWSAPAPALTLALAVSAVLVALVAWAVSRLLPRRPWALPTALAGVTWLVLTVDGATGTTLQQASLLGTSAVVGFTRFYGFNNVTFAVYAVAGLVLAGGLATAALARGRRRLAAWLVVAVGAVTVVIDGWPAFGADFGGILALVPAFAVLALLVGRVRITWLRALVVAGLTVAVVAVVAVVDWLLPGGSSHLGGFVQSVMDGAALEVIGRKALGAWDTVAQPAGALAAVLVVLVAVAALRPDRFRLPEVAQAYERWPLLRELVVALVVVAGVGSVLNDSGVIIAVMVVVVATTMIVPGFLADASPARATSGVPEPGIRRTPTMLLTVGGGLLLVVLLASAVLGSVDQRPGSAASRAGSEATVTRADAIATDRPLVVVGTTGVTWSDVTAATTPTLHALLTDGAGAGGVAQPTGAASRCTVGGWLALSAGQLAEVATERAPDGTWACPTVQPVPDDGAAGGARVDGWDDLVALQQGSGYQAHLGVLGDALAGDGTTGSASAVCATAVGPGAALALADSSGDVARYRDVSSVTTPGGDAFACPVTVVDAGDATAPPVDPDLPAEERAALRASLRTDRLASVDATVGAVLDEVPSGTTVLVVDVAGTPGTRPALGATLVRPSFDGPEQARYLTSAATRTDGVARVLDVPATVLDAAGTTAGTMPARIQDTPLAWGSPRPLDAASTADALADLTSRDHVRRAVYTAFVDVPFYAGLVVAGLCLLLAPRAARATGDRARARWSRAAHWARGAALVVAAVPTAAFLVSLTGWWRFGNQTLAIVVSTVLATAAVAGLGALAPRRPVWLGPGIVAGITFAVLTLDALVGTPLNRASPLGSAPTFGARFYGFGNPTFSVYAVAALVVAAALAQWLVARGRRYVAATVVGTIGLVTMVVDVWPTLGADLGGGLVVVPAFAVLGLAASGARVTWRRFLLVAAAGVGLVAAVGVLDWLRPADERSHLGRFVGQVVDGSAWDTLLRKAGYAARSVLGGVPVWLTIAVLVAAALLLFWPRRFTPAWFARTEEAWPLVRPTVLALWIVCVAGSLVNDFGVRIALIALIPAVPLLTVAALHAAGGATTADDPPTTGASPTVRNPDVETAQAGREPSLEA
ncbi:hypothetical protein [Cellulosimicrobium protaetiae]|uniref:Uncharacterized protein n=1 Tax=Cellulosimicrobium protaetiae TaxID=2587808 RepID=A0A6M5UHA6_9MICO|nr:hypothetical protein [Cellulosimicrobium protaetiae]QJW38027.1 hypothetical protein FIC82_019505 [Cellulosimicrobium protaetiae]